MIVLIPAYEPGEPLVGFVHSIVEAGIADHVVVVDDGSGPAYAGVFAAVAAAGCAVLGHQVNRGKGAALRTGFEHVLRRHPGQAVVCADCDGQHAVVDIERVAAAVPLDGRTVVLGARAFAGDVPARSRFGNTITRHVFRWSTGLRLTDTQTGLRGYPPGLLAWLLTIGGDRFEYELEVLLAARRAGVDLVEVPIATRYIDGNASSHFRPIRDSLRVYVPFVRFGLSSLAAFAIDATLFFALMAITGGALAVSVVTARVVSASINYAINRAVVFEHGRTRTVRASAPRYAMLAGAVLAANYALLRLLHVVLGVGLVPAKLVTEIALFVLGYRLQRRFVFGDAPAGRAAQVEPARRRHLTRTGR
jgi:putative flippase GtrA